jgi:hypothetical protein
MARLFAVWLVIEIVLGVPAIYRFFESNATAQTITVLSSIVALGVCLLLWRYPLALSRKIVPHEAQQESDPISYNDFFSAGMVLMGLWMIGSTLPHVIRQFIIAGMEEATEYVASQYFSANSIALLARILIGVWLVFNAPGLRSMLKWVRTAGVKY